MQIVVQSLKTSERRTLITGGSDARYVPTGLGSPKRAGSDLSAGALWAKAEGGHLLYALGGVLFAVPFDLRHLAVAGGPVPVVERVKRSAVGTYATAHLAVSSCDRSPWS